MEMACLGIGTKGWGGGVDCETMVVSEFLLVLCDSPPPKGA